jgi:hypothetical protein
MIEGHVSVSHMITYDCKICENSGEQVHEELLMTVSQAIETIDALGFPS